MKNTDILGGSPYGINDNSQDEDIDKEDQYDSDPKQGSTDTSVKKNKVYGLNDVEYYDEMSYENDLMPEDEDDIIRDNISEESGLSELSNEELYFQNKTIYQKKALFYKNFIIQSRAKCTNCMQMLIPVMGIAMIWLISMAGIDDISSLANQPIFNPVPYFFGMEYRALANLIGEPLKVGNCDRWFFVDWGNDTIQETKDYFGKNEGERGGETFGMINGKENVLMSPCNSVKKMVPYFRDWQKVNEEDYANEFPSVDHYLFKHLDNLQSTTMEYTNRNFDQNEDVKALPDAVYTIHEANSKLLKYDARVNDAHYWQYHRENGFTKVGIVDRERDIDTSVLKVIDGQVEAASIINKAYIKNNFKNVTVTTGINFYPMQIDFKWYVKKAQSEECVLVVPICLCLGLPVFMYQLVLEKEKRLLQTMKINGLLLVNYWIVNLVFDFIYYVITYMIFLFFAKFVFHMHVFMETNTMLLLLVFNGWGLVQISLAFLISVFIDKASTASIVGYGLSIYLMAMAQVINIFIYDIATTIPWFYHIIPTFTFQRAMQFICIKCAAYSCYSHMDMVTDPEMISCIILLYVQFVVYGALAWYLNQIVPQSYGVPKKWNWLCSKGRRVMGKPGSQGITYDYDEIGDLEEDRETNNNPVYDYNTSLEDADAKAERNIVYNLDKADYYKYPLIIKDIRKVYPGMGGRAEKVATKNFSLRIKKGEMFGLLGPNGAGKTTLISMLTGLYPPSKGNAWVAGFDIKHQLEAVQIQIGYCPQFDVLWDDMTVKEHLIFYARIKGIPPQEEEAMVTQAIEDVKLTAKTHFMTKALSGGMKRRLSVAISLVSDPKIIYLDEPSTGLDPENRRQLWDIFAALKGKRAIVLTTHSMEEADVLCNRIAIVANGILRCVAPQVRLKSLYGGGYHLQINCQKLAHLQKVRKAKKRTLRKQKEQEQNQINKSKSLDIRAHPSMIVDNDAPEEENEFEEEELTITEIHTRVKNFVKELLPKADLIQDFNGNFMYLIPTEGFNASQVYTEFEANKNRLKIADWGLSQSTLEDVFTKICEQNGGNNA